MAINIVDTAFYMIQRGETGHLNNVSLNTYGDNKIGYGTQRNNNRLNFDGKSITQDEATILAKTEMANLINEECRYKFENFDSMLPCQQALILDMAYQGKLDLIYDAIVNNNPQQLYSNLMESENRERVYVEMRAFEMGLLIEQMKEIYSDPRKLAEKLALDLIEKYQNLKGTPYELTKDELVMLYHSCMAAYGIEANDLEARAFAMGFDQVVAGNAGVGSVIPAKPLGYEVPYRPSSPALVNYQKSTYGYPMEYEEYYKPNVPRLLPSHTLYDTYNFQDESSELNINRDYLSPNRGSRNGMNPQMIVIHSTESPTVTSTINTFLSPNGTSAHYVVGRDGTIYQMVPENERANHAGRSAWRPLGIDECTGCNSASIGIEVQRGVGEGYTPEQIASVIALVKDIEQRRGILPENVVGHADVARPRGRKVDPGADFPWEAFAMEGLAYGNSFHEGRGHERNINIALNDVKSSDCMFYNNCSNFALNSETTQTQSSLSVEISETSGRVSKAKSTGKKKPSNVKERLEIAANDGAEEKGSAVRDEPEEKGSAAGGKKKLNLASVGKSIDKVIEISKQPKPKERNA